MLKFRPFILKLSKCWILILQFGIPKKSEDLSL